VSHCSESCCTDRSDPSIADDARQRTAYTSPQHHPVKTRRRNMRKYVGPLEPCFP